MTTAVMDVQTQLPPKTAIRLLAMSHFANDFFSGTLGILLAAQADTLGLSKSQIGIAASTFLLMSLLQPFLGWLADRTHHPYIMLTGASGTAIGLFICAIAGSFEIILLGTFFGGIGNAMFHPVGLATARAFGGAKKKGRTVALFMLGGNSGFGIGPFLSGFLLQEFGPSGISPYVLVNVILVPLIVWRVYPYLQVSLSNSSQGRQEQKKAQPILEQRWYQTAFVLILVYLSVVMLRGMLHHSLNTFMPTFYVEEGFSLKFAGLATSVLLVSAAVGSYIGSSLSDHYPRLLIIGSSLVLLTPLTFLLLQTTNTVLIIVLSIAAGLALNANFPILLMIGQEVFPGGASGSSGLAFGWGFVSNAAGSFLTGILADEIGLKESLEILAFLPLFAILLVFLLPRQSTET